MENTKKIDWYTLAFMAFSTVWGFGNVLNGFVYFNGVQVIFSWVLMFALYFVPYALMVGELGSAFKQSGGGVSSWIHETIGPKCAYYAGWTYWACHVTYIASKGSGGLKALSWMVFQNGSTYDTFPTIAVQMATLAVFLFFCCYKRGWGWDNFIAEADTGKGLMFPKGLRLYVKYVLPFIVFFVFVQGYIDKFFK